MIDTGLSLSRKLGVEVSGTGPRTLLFLNGFGTRQEVWDHQVAHFKGRFRTVTFDHVGSGRSVIDAYSPQRYATLHDYADDILALIDSLDLGRIILVGHSVGGMLALLVSLAEPGRCDGAVIIGASPRYLNAPGYHGGFDPADIDGVLAAMEADYHSWATGFSARIAANPEVPGLADAYAEFLRSMRPDIAQASLKTIFNADFRDYLPRVGIPVLVIQATEDIAVPMAVGRYLRDHLPDARLREVAYAGHLPHMLAPAAMTAEIEAFLAATDAGS